MANPIGPLWPELPYDAWHETCYHFASVDANCRQDPARADSLGESQLARAPVSDLAGPVHFTHGARRPLLRDSIRFHRPCARHCRQRRRRAAPRAEAAQRRGLLRRRAGGSQRARHPRRHQRESLRNRRRHRLQQGHGPCRLRSGLRAPFLAGAAAVRPCAEGIPHLLSRQVQPGAFLLGQLRSRRHALFRPLRPAVRGQDPGGRRRRDARSLFPRGQQRRLLAGGNGTDYPTFYSYAYPQPAGFRDFAVQPAAARSARRSASSCCPTTPSAPRQIRMPRCSPFCKAPTRPPPPAPTGIVRRSNVRAVAPASLVLPRRCYLGAARHLLTGSRRPRPISLRDIGVRRGERHRLNRTASTCGRNRPIRRSSGGHIMMQHSAPGSFLRGAPWQAALYALALILAIPTAPTPRHPRLPPSNHRMHSSAARARTRSPRAGT